MELHPFIVWLIASTSVFLRYVLVAGLAFLVFYVLFKNKWTVAKIQATFPKDKDYRREILYSLSSAGIFGAMAWMVFFGPLNEYTQIYRDFSEHGVAYFFLTLGLMPFMHDTYFYWTHRLMHHPKLFKKTHLVHHQSHNPSPWAAYSFHPTEAVVEAGILWVIAFLLPVHRLALSIFFLMSITINVLGHLGYELYPKGMNKHWLGKWINTSTNHNMHHKYNRGNYGLYFTFWDRMMGTTDKKYHQTYERITTEREAAKSSLNPQKSIA